MERNYQKRGYLLEDFRLFHLRDSQGTAVDYHYHEFCKLLLLISGSGSYAVEGRRYLLKPGDVVLLNSQCIHRPEFEPGQPYERIILYITPAFLQRESVGSCCLADCFTNENGPVLRLPERQWKKLQGMAEELEQELAEDRYGREIACNGLLLRLLVELGRCQKYSHVQWLDPMGPKSESMQEVVRYLDGNLTKEISVEALSAQFYLSKYHLMRRFRQETGTTIHSYLSERRLLLARDMISRGIASTEACYQVGFGSYSAFSRAYLKFFGTTPTGRGRDGSEPDVGKE